MEDNRLADLKNSIRTVVNRWRDEVLSNMLIGGTDKLAPRSLWDRLKHGMHNWWYGPQGEKENKYRWQNRFGGELGSEVVKNECFDPTALTLHEYVQIKGFVDHVEAVMNEGVPGFKSLKMYQILQDASEKLTDMLFSALKDKLLAPAVATKDATEAPSSADSGESTASPPPTSQSSDRAAPRAKPRERQKRGGSATPTTRERLPQKKDTAPPAGSQASGGPQGDTAAGGEAEQNLQRGGNKNEELAGYFQDDKAGKRYTIEEAIKKIIGFIKSVENFKKNKDLKDWWINKAKEYERTFKSQGESETLGHIWRELVATDLILDSIEKITRVPKSELKKMMVQYLAGDLPAVDTPRDEGTDEEDASLNLDAYFKTDGVEDSPERAMEKIKGFISNPLNSIGLSANPELIEALSRWWAGAKDEMEKSSEKSDFIARNMSERPEDPSYVPPFVGQIAKIMDKSPKYIANLMRKHIRKKSNRQ